METRNYSKEIANEIDKFLKEDEGLYNFDEQNGVFHFDLCIESRLRKISYVITVGKSDFTVYVLSPISADSNDKGMMSNMAEFICRVNYELKRGSLEFDFRDGEIGCKIHVPCEGILPTTEMIKNSIYYQTHIFEKYGYGIADIIFNKLSAENAIVRCDGSKESRIERLIAQMVEESYNIYDIWELYNILFTKYRDLLSDKEYANLVKKYNGIFDIPMPGITDSYTR